jgi:endonuclease/exonuclease/phosphatase family metal-dependent hydrolase
MKSTLFDDFRQQARGWATTSLTVLFGLQLVRVLFPSFVGYLRDSQGVGSLALAPIALGIFATSFLAGLVRRVTGPRLAIWITAGGVGLIRLIEQVSTSPSLDLVLSAAGVALFLLFIPNALGVARAKEPVLSPSTLLRINSAEGPVLSLPKGIDGTTLFGFAFLLGMAADTAIHIGARTLDLSWQPGIIPIAIIALLAVGLFAALYASASEIDPQAASDGSWGRSFALAALGPWLFLQLLAYQNVARVSALTGWETPAAGALVVLGNALGLVAAAWLTRSRLRTSGTAIASGLLLIGSLIYAEPTGVSGALLLLAGQILSLVLAMMLFAGLGRDATQAGLARTTVANGVGQILIVLITFIYYVTYDIALGFRAQVLLPLAALLVGIGAVIASRGRSGQDEIPQGEAPAYYQPAIAGLLLLVAPLALSLTWSKPQAVSPDPTNTTIRVMDYNVHNGFNTAGRLDVEALANIIEESEADVVGLQEISRGWLIWGGTDMLTWLSQRLDMPYVSGPASDAQWGNAILSRYPIVSAETFPLPPDNLLLLRGYIVAEIDVGSATLTVIDTHFTHRGQHDEIRELQATELARAWDGAAATVIVGDMNAVPDSDAMRLLSSAGLVNVAAEIGTPPIYTSPADNPNRQIDYIWTSPDLGFSDLEIFQTTASDHLPVVATITLP